MATRIDSRQIIKRSILNNLGIDVENKQLDAVLNELDSHLGQLRIQPLDTPNDRVKVTGATVDKLNGMKLGQSITQLIMETDGAQIDFTTGQIFESDGTTALGLDFTPTTIPADHYRWYSVTVIPGQVNTDNTIGVQLIVIPADDTNLDPALASKASFATGTPLGQVRVKMNAGGTALEVIDWDSIVQLGTSGGGSGGTGDASELQERLKNSLQTSRYNHVTPNIFSLQEEDLTDDANTTVGFSIIDSAYAFQSTQVLTTLNLLDSEILNKYNFDITKARVDFFWDLEALDESATYEVSRDGGNEWQTLTANRLDDSDAFVAEHTFTEEATNGFSLSVNTANGFTDLATADLSEPFSLTNPTTLKNISFDIEVTGDPTGFFAIKIVADDAGSPSTALDDVLYSSNPIDTAPLVTSTFSKDVVVPLASGTYHLVIEPLSTYIQSFNDSAGADKISIASETGALAYSLAGREKDLRVRVTAGTNDVILKGMGAFYRKASELSFFDNQKLIFKTRFLSNTDNLNSFVLPFMPNADLLQVFVLGTGQTFVYDDFALQGKTVIFPEDTFLAGSDEEVTLKFIQVGNVSTIDNSDSNAALLAANHLGSTDGSIDKSSNGRGVFLRKPNGALVEVTIDDNNNIAIFSV